MGTRRGARQGSLHQATMPGSLPKTASTHGVGHGHAGVGTCPSVPPNSLFLPAVALDGVAQCSSEATMCTTVKGAAPRHCLVHAGPGSPSRPPPPRGSGAHASMAGWATVCGTGQWGWWGMCLSLSCGTGAVCCPGGGCSPRLLGSSPCSDMKQGQAGCFLEKVLLSVAIY